MLHHAGRGGGEGGGGGGAGGNGNLGVILVRVCEPVFQNLPHSYTFSRNHDPVAIGKYRTNVCLPMILF